VLYVWALARRDASGYRALCSTWRTMSFFPRLVSTLLVGSIVLFWAGAIVFGIDPAPTSTSTPRVTTPASSSSSALTAAPSPNPHID
jgi:hypothetical protein